MKRLILLLMLASPAAAQQVTPNFTQGSMQSTTTTTVDIDRTIETNIYGGDYKSWSGTNVVPSGDILNDSTTYSVHTAGDQFQLETVVRDAGVVENIVVEEVIESTSTTTSLSVFSQ
jgi:hypothetical protein|tara:strand:- start:1225 stop:1575 length:351 start_codon:yes stop_codon:yes gene_type:complete